MARAKAHGGWQETLAHYEGVLFVIPECNHPLAAWMGNALDQAHVNRKYKAFGSVGNGGV